MPCRGPRPSFHLLGLRPCLQILLRHTTYRHHHMPIYARYAIAVPCRIWLCYASLGQGGDSPVCLHLPGLRRFFSALMEPPEEPTQRDQEGPPKGTPVDQVALKGRRIDQNGSCGGSSPPDNRPIGPTPGP